ncbi:TetR/AcrR family transcriptional regulator [Alteromonas aestuariivivens]|uniref:TetR/AcrR family transcriptional regulator n=1 Tax=Alteromonas aestuariivivens TaxID=1938339 RepID=A0A3D8M2L2_9ALTE|nr:TetR family transcriptional regulator [Alteromonas aestuariivivens]RDV23943.1 TetR/AcrR family transcriptional regulator [Alteromonas aestuariivivens]
MPRTALYDLNAVLEQAVSIFLEHSFYGASMDEIIARTEFNRRGFYLEFGSKQHFLYRVLEHYQQYQLFPIISEMELQPGIESIQRFFKRYIELIHQRGCLLINSVTELGRQDPVIRDMGRHYLDRLQFDFIGCLEKAQHQGMVMPDINLESAALQLTSYVQGFAVNSILADSALEMELATHTLLHPLLTNK